MIFPRHRLLLTVIFLACTFGCSQQVDEQNSGKESAATSADTGKNHVQSSGTEVKNGNNEQIKYSLRKVNIRNQASTKGKILSTVSPATRLGVLSEEKEWDQVKLPSGKTGYVFSKNLGHNWIKIWKKEHKLMLMSGNQLIKTYPIGLGFNPIDDKIKQGDGCTPEGRFFICEMLPNPQPPERYGARSLRLSYPGIEDARRGLKDKLISRSQYLAILEAVKAGRQPPQNTKLGGSIRIHGGGAGADWTLGCIALDDQELIELYSQLPSNNAMVEVYKSQAQEKTLNAPGYSSNMILKGAKNLFKAQCKYTSSATAIIPVSYPMGDFDKKIGVCTDVIIRAMRHAAIDLQALLYEDILTYPKRYPNIRRPNANIDHRRTRNLKRLFEHHAKVLSNDTPEKSPKSWRPGDIVLMDTGVNNGTIYDHIGIVSDTHLKGRPLVINLWTIGYNLEEMDLLDGEYPEIVGHYRMLHPFNYSAMP